MKYIAPEFATIVVDTEDIILASQGKPTDDLDTPEVEL